MHQLFSGQQRLRVPELSFSRSREQVNYYERVTMNGCRHGFVLSFELLSILLALASSSDHDNFNIVTYNTGLTGGGGGLKIPYYTQRREALKSLVSSNTLYGDGIGAFI